MFWTWPRHLPPLARKPQRNTAAAFFQRPGPDLPKCYDPIGVTRTVLKPFRRRHRKLSQNGEVMASELFFFSTD